MALEVVEDVQIRYLKCDRSVISSWAFMDSGPSWILGLRGFGKRLYDRVSG